MANEKRLIDADVTTEAFTKWLTSTYDGRMPGDIVAEIPAVDAVEVVHGRWVDRYGGKYANPVYDCSECNKSAPLMHDMDMLGNWRARQYFSNYCPTCGAKMDGDGNG